MTLKEGRKVLDLIRTAQEMVGQAHTILERANENDEVADGETEEAESFAYDAHSLLGAVLECLEDFNPKVKT